MLRQMLRLFLPVSIVVACSVPAHSADTRPRVVLAVDGTGQLRNLPVLVAERLGYFRDEGLTVTLVDAVAEPTPADLMKDGRADGAVAFYHHTFRTQADGLPTQAVVVMGGSPQLKLLLSNRHAGQIKTVADLRGMKIFTGGVNSGKTTTMNWLAIRAGFGVKGYAALPLASRDRMAEAMRSGAADAIIAHEPDAAYYVRTHAAFILADINSVEGTRAALGDIYPSTSLFMPRAYVAAHPDIVQGLVNACLRALSFINTNDPTQIAAILPPKVVGEDRVAFLRMLAEDKLAFGTDGRLSPTAARAQLAAMSALTPSYAGLDVDQTYTNVFVDRAMRR